MPDGCADIKEKNAIELKGEGKTTSALFSSTTQKTAESNWTNLIDRASKEGTVEFQGGGKILNREKRKTK